MSDFQLPGIVRLPGADEQAKGQVIEPAREQHFLAAKQIFKARKGKQMPPSCRSAEMNNGKNSSRNQQHDRRTECDGLGILPARNEHQQCPGYKNQDTGVPVKIVGRHI